MAREMLSAGVRRCYACIQWEGVRTFYREKKEIKVDAHETGHCLIFKVKKTGNSTCERFEPIR